MAHLYTRPGMGIRSRVNKIAKPKGTDSCQQSTTVPSNDTSKWDGTSYRVDLKKDDENYGCPVAGSKADQRGRQAGVRISNEVVELCKVIKGLGQEQEDGSYTVQFGPLFEMYTKISNKLVGMLMRARKHKLIEFEGEMLFQRRDDHVVIRLVEMPPETPDE